MDFSYKLTSLEALFQFDVLVEHDLRNLDFSSLLIADSSELSSGRCEPQGNESIHPMDKALLEDEDHFECSVKQRMHNAEAGDSNQTKRVRIDTSRNKVVVGNKHQLEYDRRWMIARIKRTFNQAKIKVVRHHDKKKPGVFCVEEIPFFPDEKQEMEKYFARLFA